MKLERDLKKTRIRLPHYTNRGTYNKFKGMAEKHIPEPRKTVFMEFLLGLGMDAHERGERLNKRLAFKGNNTERFRFNYYLKASLVERLYELLRAQEPQPIGLKFFQHVLELGMQEYYREYTIYGFKRR